MSVFTDSGQFRATNIIRENMLVSCRDMSWLTGCLTECWLTIDWLTIDWLTDYWLSNHRLVVLLFLHYQMSIVHILNSTTIN